MSRPPFFLAYEDAPGKPSGKHPHTVGPCTCPDRPEPVKQYPEPEPRSLVADALTAVLTLLARRMP